MVMRINATAEQEIVVGEAVVVEGCAPEGPYVAVFEDDETTGYFYALDTSCKGNKIQDALQVYNVANVTDRAKPSMVTIGWSHDSKKVALLINGRTHAVFDFSSQRGFCRTGFPPPPKASGWSKPGHQWSDAAIGLFE